MQSMEIANHRQTHNSHCAFVFNLVIISMGSYALIIVHKMHCFQKTK